MGIFSPKAVLWLRCAFLMSFCRGFLHLHSVLLDVLYWGPVNSAGSICQVASYAVNVLCSNRNGLSVWGERLVHFRLQIAEVLTELLASHLPAPQIAATAFPHQEISKCFSLPGEASSYSAAGTIQVKQVSYLFPDQCIADGSTSSSCTSPHYVHVVNSTWCYTGL